MSFFKAEECHPPIPPTFLTGGHSKVLRLLARFSEQVRDLHLLLTSNGTDHPRTIGVMLVSLVSLIGLLLTTSITRTLGKTESGTFQGILSHFFPTPTFTALVLWVGGCLFFFALIPILFIRYGLKESLKNYGLGWQNAGRESIRGLFLYLPIAPLLWIASYSPTFHQKYPFYREPASALHLLTWELFYGLQFVALEFFFRGFMIHGTKRQLGIYSVLWMIPSYVLIHTGKPLPEICGSAFLGLILGGLSLRTTSIFAGVSLHLAIAWSMDGFVLWHR